MPFKTINITVVEYYGMDKIICVEYVDIDSPGNKYLKVINTKEYDDEVINIFKYEDIPDNIKNIYEYCKENSYIKMEDDMHIIFGKRIHNLNNKCQRLMYHDFDPLEKIIEKIDEENKIGNINNETIAYYDGVLNTIKFKEQLIV